SLPPYFSPVKIDGQLHADGGIMNNFPVELIRKQCDVVIGSYVCPLEKSGNNSLNNTLSVWWRAYTLNFYAISKSKFQQCDYVFEPYDLCEIGTLDTKSIERAYQIGYETAKEEMKFLLEAIYAQSAKRLNMAMAA
ncbi:MAG: patatin-like phospholipase family protein, partial [Bacteroidota bacterium]